MNILSSGSGCTRQKRRFVTPLLWVIYATNWKGAEPLTNTPVVPAS
jgi:hypothetical protein